MRDLQSDRTTEITSAKSLLTRIKASGREPTNAENATLQGHLDEVANLDRQIKGRALVHSVTSLGSSEDFAGDGTPQPGIFSEQIGKDLVSAIRTKGRFRTEVSTKAALGVTGVLPTSGQLAAPGLFPNAAVTGPTPGSWTQGLITLRLAA
jgi:hypothetical protein